MASFLQFGEDHPDYSVRVLNEREARGAAGIMFLFAMIAFMTAWFKGDFTPTSLLTDAHHGAMDGQQSDRRICRSATETLCLVNRSSACHIHDLSCRDQRCAWADQHDHLPGLSDTAVFRIGIWNLRGLQDVQLVQQRKGATLSRQCV